MDKNYPEAPHILSTDVGAWDEYKRLRDLRQQEGLIDLQQRMNPAREMNLGQVSKLSGHPMADLASPGQMKEYPEPSRVPHYNAVPTMTNGPEVQGPYDIRQDPDIESRPSPVTQHYPTGGADEQVTPQLRQAYNKPIATLQEEPGAPNNISRPNPEAPSDRWQQILGTSSLDRESKWPRSMGGGGANTLQAKINALVQSGMDEDEARQYAVLGSSADDKTSNLKARTRASSSRADSLDAGVDLGRDKFAEQQRMNDWSKDYKNRQLQLATDRHKEGVQRGEQSNELGWARLNNKRWYEDNLLAIYGDVNKSGRFSPEESDALHKGMGFLETMKQRDLSPEEESVWSGVKRFLNIPEPPAYSWKPREPLKPSQPQKGVAGAISRPSGGSTPGATGPIQKPQTGGDAAGAFADAPPGKSEGDTLKSGGKPVAKWTKGQWQAIQ